MNSDFFRNASKWIIVIIDRLNLSTAVETKSGNNQF